jgi:hypothetical protein
MAPEQKYELIDQYLTGKMSSEEAHAFEQQLKADPQLQKEVAFQRQIIEGIRQARVAQLKAMLNQVPVPPANPATSGMVVKVISSVVIIGSVVSGVYFYLQPDNPPVATPANQEIGVSADNPIIDNNSTTAIENQADEGGSQIDSSSVSYKSPVAPKTAPATKNRKNAEPQPAMKIYVPETDENPEYDQTERQHAKVIDKGFVTSSIIVEKSTETAYNFHYAFHNNKLILYGNFEDNLYEILEFLSGKERTVVLFYKNKYYLLDTTKEEPTALVPIRDKILLNKLQKYRQK